MMEKRIFNKSKWKELELNGCNQEDDYNVKTYE